MNWLFGKNLEVSSLTSTTPLQQQRLKQIKSLNTYHQNVVEVKRDSEYTVSFHCCAKTIILKIVLPKQFPNEKPIVYALPSFTHQWVDDQMRVVGSPGLNMFYMHSDLGKVIQHIIKEFKKNPPQFSSSRDYEAPPIPSGFSSSYQSTPISNFINTPTSTNQDATVRPPLYTSSRKVVSNKTSCGNLEIDAVMDKLDQLQKDELERISNNPELLLDYILEMQSVVNLQAERAKLVEDNENIAQKNMSLEPVIEDLKGELKEMFEEYNDIYNKFQVGARIQDEYWQIFDVNTISTNLRISLMQSEEESEKIAEDFLQVFSFREYIAGRISSEFSEEEKALSLQKIERRTS
ncbi:vacuolar protein sorting-associated protein 37A-like isoform X2 [Hydractinia symbiolongicarpus]|uniref:vacuolar protein sorting-associated protein 37A-like isoform X2 n=1 Tax=Hydractinia symbiolongicarpus TaxID=13093 RepID=UPI00254C4305|nr:vacuolar protein sorting-associated protein 37A-like isoform X2 [Hydractinia symbiolongicarpus]